ncbi:hypothetical protein [Parasphingopyxis sp.]|uniref:hypothetical protein n=1 Tax=Parasphingopyxis sp. TaxID=1920299 RepID=UPI002611F12A|nr:hypothetical protein [Parasphingopyxis sp.]
MLERNFIPNPNDPIELPRLPIEFRHPLERPALRHLRWGPARVKILIVTDGAGYDETSGFGLGIMIADAFDENHPDHPDYARFEFTKAQRFGSSGVTPGYDDFEFTAGSLDDFDELWLFGVSTAAPYLQPGEVGVIEEFMDRGGGVLAMGDHEDLGLGLCGGIKRVRSMRKWWFQNPAPPANMEVAPDNANLTRNDTVQAPVPGGNVNSGTQSDATPQPVYPNYRYRWQWHFWRPWNRVKYPHPLLCGPRGVIKVFPDHAHEGDCIIPNAAFADEYPGDVDVEIVARGRNVVGRTKFGGNQITDPREFGLIGAWDGHDPSTDGAGRVVVDATWHHWFNVNLFGLRAEDGVEYADILAFFRNVAVWLAPKDEQARMRRAGQLITLLIPSQFEHTLTLHKFRPELIYWFGIYARDALGKIAPQCQSAAWYFDIIRPHLSERLIDTLRLREDIDFDRESIASARFEAIATETVGTSIFGGAMQAVAAEIQAERFDDLEAIAEKIDGLSEEGGKAGAEMAEKQLRIIADSFAKLSG